LPSGPPRSVIVWKARHDDVPWLGDVSIARIDCLAS